MLTACRTGPKPQRSEQVRRSQPLLGTFVTITAHGSNRARLNQAITEAYDEIRRVDAIMSVHRQDSELARVNALAADQAVTVSPALFSVLSTAQRISRETDGSFDITTRPLNDLWGFIWKQHRLPTRAELDDVLSCVGFDLVVMEPTDGTVRFSKPGVSLDLGGIAKGYAVDAAIERLRMWGITNAMVKAGGDLRVMGAPPGRSAWTVQLEDPRKQGRRISISLTNAALSTSGDYENYFVRDGRRYSHILDPRTGMPVDEAAACTVVAATCMESDAWATAFLVYGVQQSLDRFGDRLGIWFTIAPPPGSTDPLEFRVSDAFPSSTAHESSR